MDCLITHLKEITLLIGLLAAVIGLITAIINWRKGKKSETSPHDSKVKAENSGSIGGDQITGKQIDDKPLRHVDHTASLRATLTINRQLLDNPQIMKLLAAIVCFEPDSINPKLLSAVYGVDWEQNKEQVWKLISSLHNYSLIQIQSDNRINIHRLMLQAVREQISQEMLAQMQVEYVKRLTAWSDKICSDVTQLKAVSLEIEHLTAAARLAQTKNIWPQTFDLAINLGNYYGNLGRHQEKLTWLEPLESVLKAQQPPDKPKLGLLLNNLGSAWDSLGEYKKAIEYYEQALSIGREYFGERHPQVATDLNNLGSAWYSLKDYEQARQCMQQAYSIRLEFLGPEHPSTKTAKANLDSIP